MKCVKILASAAMAIGLPLGAQAASCDIDPNGNVEKVTFTLETSGGATCVAGNNLGNNGIVATDMELFNLDGWVLGDSTDPNENSDNGNVTFTTAPATNTTDGSWGITNPSLYSPIMIVLKSGDQYGAFSPIQGTSGTWSITQTNGTTETAKEISHADVYYQPTVVPLPAAAWFILSVCGGWLLLGRRRRAA